MAVAASRNIKSILAVSESERQNDLLHPALLATNVLAVFLVAALAATFVAFHRARRAQAVAQAASSARSNFLAVMSHEIRTPLNGYLGMNALLLDTGLSPEQREYVETANRSAQDLQALLGDILDLSRIDAGKLEFRPAPFSLNVVIEDVVRLTRAAGGGKPVHVCAEIPDWLPRRLVGDKARIRQILLNLTMNAQKFTEEGDITIRLECPHPEKSPVDIRVLVEDTGMGIPPAVLPRIFDRFEQGDASSTRRHGGSGLGLAIAKELVEQMGGGIGADSTGDHGSVFWFTLRLPIGNPTAVVPAALEPGGPIEGRVLVAEDNATNQKLTVRFLEKLGLETDVATNGEEAVRLAKSHGYGAILMDCHMPVMDGFEATAAIRRGEQGRAHTPVIAISADVSAETRARCVSSGMDDFIGKPVRYEEIDRVLRAWLSK